MSDDGETPAERSVNELVAHLEGKAEAHDIRSRKYTVDFTIGDPNLWPRYGADDELNAIRSSSVSFGGLTPHNDGKAVQGNPQTGSNIHLPPGLESLWGELEEEADFGEKFSLVNGTFKLGGLLPPPDGVCTPHIIITGEAEIDEVKNAIDEAFRLYETVYAGGKRVVKTQPTE